MMLLPMRDSRHIAPALLCLLTTVASSDLIWAQTNQTSDSQRMLRCLRTEYLPDHPDEWSTDSHGWLQNVETRWWQWNEQTQDYDKTLLANNSYSFDSVGNNLENALSLASSDRTEAYGYDRLYRLTSVDYESDATIDARWAYHPAGNRISDRLDLAQNAWYDNANMLLNRAGQNYTNDLNGNTLTGGGRANIWDSQNRLVQTTFDGSTTGFTYGPDGLRRTATTGGVATQYILDGQNVVQEVSPSGVVSYLWGPRGPECRVAPNGSALWYLYDGHGNVLGEVNSQGVINPDMNGDPTVTRDFDPWGFVLNYQQVANNGNKLKYCGALGHPSENTSGLIYMRARYYDPLLGRFISEDPARDGGNWYAYAGGNPVGMVDADGQEPLEVGRLYKWKDYACRLDAAGDLHVWKGGKLLGAIYRDLSVRHEGKGITRTFLKFLARDTDFFSKATKLKMGLSIGAISSLDAYARANDERQLLFPLDDDYFPRLVASV